ncbi:unnamed protein product [Effrenium voratum]|nr:unnamed protein product [Effrenium voratum]
MCFRAKPIFALAVGASLPGWLHAATNGAGPRAEPAVLIRDNDVLALSWEPSEPASRCRSRGDLAGRRRLEGAARRAGLPASQDLPGDEPELFDDDLLGGWPKAVAAWTRERQKTLMPKTRLQAPCLQPV